MGDLSGAGEIPIEVIAHTTARVSVRQGVKDYGKTSVTSCCAADAKWTDIGRGRPRSLVESQPPKSALPSPRK